VRSRHGSDSDFSEQTFVRVENGGVYEFENASFESLGNEAWGSGEGSGILIQGFDGTTDPGGIFDTVEVYRYAGDAGLKWEDSTDFDVDWLYMHWAHPQITVNNEGHGLKFEQAKSIFSFHDVRVRHARFDRGNDDFVWWSTGTSGESGVYDSIARYCPITSAGHSCDGVDTLDEFGANGGQLRIERNLFTNLGSDHGSRCLIAGAAYPSPQIAWREQGWVALDNVCLNLQAGECMIVAGGERAWDREAIHAVKTSAPRSATTVSREFPRCTRTRSSTSACEGSVGPTVSARPTWRGAT
jgi:hypothetical protein